MTPTRIIRAIMVCLISLVSMLTVYAQCTVSGSGSIAFSSITCSETGSAPVSGDHIIIPDGVTITSSSNSESFGIHDITVESGGVLQIDHNNVYLDGNIFIENGGLLQINGKIEMECGSGIALEAGGTIKTGSSAGASDRLTICDNPIIQGGGDCETADGSADASPPYCAGGTGITIETSFDESGEAPGVLPVALLSFSADDQPEGVMVEWTTAVEERNAYFDLENSKDGQSYNPVGRIEGAGNSTSLKHYSFLHESPYTGISYYRLVQVDTDDSRTIYGPVRVDRTVVGQLAVYPNPVHTGQQLTIRRSAGDEGELNISLMDLQGRIIHHWDMTSTNSMNLDIPGSLDKGIYLLEISGGGKKMLHRLVLQ